MNKQGPYRAAADRQANPIDVKGAPQVFPVLPAEFTTDDGPHKMTYEDALAIVAIFEKRGVDMSIDFDHASTDTSAPPEARVAAGWIPCPGGLEAREDGSVWAVSVNWDPKVAVWLTDDPPKYRYISPWYTYREDGGFAIPQRLVNIALTNNPKTWGCQRLASLALSGVPTMNDMDLKSAGAILVALVALVGSQDQGLADWAKEQDAALRAKLGENADKAMQLVQDEVVEPANVEVVDAAAASVATEAERTPEEKMAAASLAKIKPSIVRAANDKKAIDKLIEDNRAVLREDAIPLLRKASLVDAKAFVDDVTTNVRRPAKAPLNPGVTPGGKTPVTDERVASLAKDTGIKDTASLRKHLANGIKVAV